jgi:putative alpha-1,2-mannosidase
VKSASFNGRSQNQVWLSWEQLQAAGTLSYKLAPQPDTKGWGTHRGDLPNAPADTPN